jgi:hypothetical protein
MSEFWTFLFRSTWVASLACGVLWLLRSAIASALAHASAREIERLRGELAKDLEGYRQSFAREMDRVHQTATRDLELFKAELSKEAEARRETVARETESGRVEAQRLLEGFKAELALEAEVRRQVAIRKVEALLKIVEAGDHLFSQMFGGERNVDALVAAMRPYAEAIRRSEHLFAPEMAKLFRKYGMELLRHESDWRERNDPSFLEGARAELEGLLNLARQELQIVRRPALRGAIADASPAPITSEDAEERGRV